MKVTGNVSSSFQIELCAEVRVRNFPMVVQDVNRWSGEERSTKGRRTEEKILDQKHREWFLSQLLFADDALLAAESAKQLHCLVRELELVCERRKLRVKEGNFFTDMEREWFAPQGGVGVSDEIIMVDSSFK